MSSAKEVGGRSAPHLPLVERPRGDKPEGGGKFQEREEDPGVAELRATQDMERSLILLLFIKTEPDST